MQDRWIGAMVWSATFRDGAAQHAASIHSIVKHRRSNLENHVNLTNTNYEKKNLLHAYLWPQPDYTTNWETWLLYARCSIV